MKNINLTNKKIGIWGFGIVGQSVLRYVEQFTNQIQIMDQKSNSTSTITQTPQNITQFLQYNDIIIPSPGIVLHEYQEYAHKFLQELDIFAQKFHGTTIAITGTVGKTTITSLLTQTTPDAISAGNIGYAMLNVLSTQPRPKKIILELSSYQLQFAKAFAPDIAIWTNFYPNHLDHHTNEQEYFEAKCNMIKHQTPNQIALLPYNLIEKITAFIQPQAQIYLFSEQEPELTNFPTFFIKNNQLILQKNNFTSVILDNFKNLPSITFTQNWIVIAATLHLQNINLENFVTFANQLKPEPHRCEFIKNLHGVAVYNDSKSTVWQATKQAINKFSEKKIALFLGGISKGTDRTPLIQNLDNKFVTVFAFGKEAEILANLCQQFNIANFQATTLQEIFQKYLHHQNNFEILLFSPAGASFDLFKNFEDRGIQFKNMVINIKL